MPEGSPMLETSPEASPAEKHGGLFGGALTDEAILSSRAVLRNARGNKEASIR